VEPATKPCRDCGAHKPLDQFPLQKGGRWGRHPLCKPCRAAQERERYQRYRDRILATQAADPARREKQRWRDLRRRRGASREQYEAMYKAQRGRCAICGTPHDVLHVDHDHSTGRVRGLLCGRCNLALGHFRDDPEALRAAARYLREKQVTP
jgi:hypothetical protein